MKIGLISDIHGNLPALKAVLEHIKTKNVDLVYCLGDLVGKGPKPEETIALIQTHCQKAVLGNWDDFLLHSPVSGPFIDWYRQQLSKDSYDYLNTLPYTINFDLGSFCISAFHAHSTNVHKRVHRKSDYSTKLEMFQVSSGQAMPNLVIYGDIHYNFIEQLGSNLVLANTGSVGNPLDGTLAKYIILEGEALSCKSKESLNLVKQNPYSYTITCNEGHLLKISFETVPYDISQAIEDVLNSDMPDQEMFIGELKTGQYRYLHHKTPKNPK